MRRIVRKQVTTIEIVSVELTWAEEKEPDEAAMQKTKPTRRKKKTTARKRPKKVSPPLLNSTSK
jgi:hypothetical protein